MSEMPKYSTHLEGHSATTTGNQPEGVSEANKEKNDGWGHRTQMTRNSFSRERQRAISAEVEENQVGKEIRLKDHKEEQEKHPKSPTHGETSESDYNLGKELTKKERAAKNHGEYWPDKKKREFLSETPLTADQLGWDVDTSVKGRIEEAVEEADEILNE